MSFAYWRRFKTASLISMVLQPLLYLGAMGVGVGALVDERADSAAALDGLSYLAFIGPGLLVITAMMAAGNELMWPVLGGFKWDRTYHGMAATVLSPRDVAGGVALWGAARGGASAAAVAVVLAGFDDARSLGLVPAVLAAIAAALAVGLPIAAWTATRDGPVSLPVIARFGLFPMFLLSGAFFPIDQLPGWAQPIAWVAPPYHGIELARGFTAGGLAPGAAVAHLAVLATFIVGGYLASRATFTRALYS